MDKKKTLRALFVVVLAILLMFSLTVAAFGGISKISKTKSTLYVGHSITLSVNDVSKKVKWKSSNKKIVAVKSIGKNKAKVSAQEKGSAVVTASVDGKKYTCKIIAKYKKVNKNMTLKLHNIGTKKGKYVGEVKNGKPNGSGKFTTTNSDGEIWYYEGGWKNGQMNGKGITCWPESNDKEEGTYIDSELVYGKCYFDGVLFYEGGFENEQRSGIGTIYNKEGEAVYSGSMKNDVPTDYTQLIEKSRELSYNELARYDKKYMYSLIKWSGRVLQVIEGDNGDVEYRIAEGSNVSNVMYCYYTRDEDEARILEGDYITVYGLSDGLYTYESVGSGYLTIPSMDIYYVQ